MTACVLDASVTLSWMFEDEAAPAYDEIFRLVHDHGARVPAIWPLEVTNVLLQAEKRNRIDGIVVSEWLDILANIPITVDSPPPSDIFGIIQPLAHAQRLTAYDASYLDVAMRHGLPLATKDTALSAAARRMRVDVLPGY